MFVRLSKINVGKEDKVFRKAVYINDKFIIEQDNKIIAIGALDKSTICSDTYVYNMSVSAECPTDVEHIANAAKDFVAKAWKSDYPMRKARKRFYVVDDLDNSEMAKGAKVYVDLVFSLSKEY